MRNETPGLNSSVDEMVSSIKLHTHFSKKEIHLELNQSDLKNVLHYQFSNGDHYDLTAVLEKAVDGFGFKPISTVEQKDDRVFHFEDFETDKGKKLYYRLLLKEKNGVTYYSKIISCSN